jgi:hypothetical protein
MTGGQTSPDELVRAERHDFVPRAAAIAMHKSGNRSHDGARRWN